MKTAVCYHCREEIHYQADARMWSHDDGLLCKNTAAPVAETIVDGESREAEPVEITTSAMREMVDTVRAATDAELQALHEASVSNQAAANARTSPPVTLKRPVLERPVASERAEPKPQREKRTRAPKATPTPAAPPEEPAPAIEVDASDDPIHVRPEDAPYLEPGRPLAAQETNAACDICGRTLPARLLAMHRANCERAAKGLS